MEIFHTIEVMLTLRMGVGHGVKTFHVRFCGSHPLLFRILNFSGSSVFYGSSAKFTECVSFGFHDCFLGTDCKSVIN